MKLGLVFGSEMVFYVFFRLEYPASSNGVTRGSFFLSEPVIRYRTPGYVSTAGLKPFAGNPAGWSVMFRRFTDWTGGLLFFAQVDRYLFFKSFFEGNQRFGAG